MEFLLLLVQVRLSVTSRGATLKFVAFWYPGDVKQTELNSILAAPKIWPLGEELTQIRLNTHIW